jgi:hypothetical protein
MPVFTQSQKPRKTDTGTDSIAICHIIAATRSRPLDPRLSAKNNPHAPPDHTLRPLVLWMRNNSESRAFHSHDKQSIRHFLSPILKS